MKTRTECFEYFKQNPLMSQQLFQLTGKSYVQHKTEYLNQYIDEVEENLKVLQNKETKSFWSFLKNFFKR